VCPRTSRGHTPPQDPRKLCEEGLWKPGTVALFRGLCLAFWPVLILQDSKLFQEDGGWDVVSSVAEFWCSRVEWSSQDKMYHLKGEDLRA
jgi:hypothetical protein